MTDLTRLLYYFFLLTPTANQLVNKINYLTKSISQTKSIS